MSNNFSLSIIVPTIGRTTLPRTLGSLRANQRWMEGDEIILVGDGRQPIAEELWRQPHLHLPGRYLETPTQLGYWGHGVRNWILDSKIATGKYLMALDDDDTYVPDTLETVRKALRHAPERPHLFRMSTWQGIAVWREPKLARNKVGTPMFVVPNKPLMLGRYAPVYGGDFDFIEESVAYYPNGSLVWRPEVICKVKH